MSYFDDDDEEDMPDPRDPLGYVAEDALFCVGGPLAEDEDDEDA